jgi:hypothetical protein
MATLANNIPNQYAIIDSAFSFTFDSGTFTGTLLTYQLKIARNGGNLTIDREFAHSDEDANWISFNGSTRTISGTPSGFGQKRSYQLVVEATDDSGDVAYGHFLLTVTDSGTKPCCRHDQFYDHVITSSNIDAFDSGIVASGEFVFIRDSVGDPSAGNTTKINTIRTAGGILCWEITLTNRDVIDYSKILGGDTIGLVSGIEAFTMATELTTNVAAGTAGNPIFITNICTYNVSNTPSDNGIVTVTNGGTNRPGIILGTGVDRFILIGQGDENDCLGLKITSTNQAAFNIGGLGLKYEMEIAWVEIPSTRGIGMFPKCDLSCGGGGTRPDNDWDGLQWHDCYTRDCTNHNTGGEGFYVTNGFYTGNVGACPGTTLYCNDIRNARFEWNIVERSGWDGFQVTGIVKNGRINHNYIKDSGIGGPNGLPAPAQSNGSQLGCDGEIAYNWIENSGYSGIRFAVLCAQTDIHHNIIFNHPDAAFYMNRGGGDNGYVTTEYGGVGKIPNYLYASRTDIIEANLYTNFYNNTIIECGQFTRGIHDVPTCNVKNNLIINSGITYGDGWTNKTTANNVFLDGIDPSDVFADYGNKDFRIKSGSAADGAGADVGMAYDFSGKAIATSFAVGAFERLSFINENHYNYIINGVTPPPTTSFQWYSAIDSGGAPDLGTKTAILGEVGVELTPTSDQHGKWVARGVTPRAKTGIPDGSEDLSNWLYVTLPDTTPPTFSSSSITGVGSTAFNLSTTTNETATTYFVVVADAATAPSVEQIKLGQDSTGSAALISGNDTGISITQLVSGATASTAYDVYFVARDTSGNDQASVTKLDVTTTSGSIASTVTAIAINSRNDVAVSMNPDGYVEYLPIDFDPSGATKYPVLYWLHGVGSDETGDGTISASGLNKTLSKTVANWLATNDVPFIVLVPQDHNGLWGTRFQTFVVWANEEYAAVIDPLQQHAAGLSGGGYGIRNFFRDDTAESNAFATFTPMSTSWATINTSTYWNRVIDDNQHIWWHHGDSDGTIPSNTNFHDGVYAIDSTRTRYTLYSGMGHSAWNETYDASGIGKSQTTGGNYYEWTTGTWWQWMLDNAKP